MKRIAYLRSTSITNDSRATKEINSYVDLGYEVIVLGWDRQNIVNDFFFFGSNVKFLLYKQTSSYGSGIKNIFKLYDFHIWIKNNLKKYKDSFDIIHACDFDTAIACYKFSKKYGKKMIYDIYDYYSDCHKLGFLRYLVEKIDIHLINNSDCVVLCTEQRKKQISLAHPKKSVIIHNTPNISLNSNFHKKEDNLIRICYVGILQDDRLLIELSKAICNEKKYQLHIGGFGKYEEYFKELADKNDNVFFYGQMDYDKVLKLEEKCDVLFATYNPQILNHRYSAPNKVYEAMALGKPIIVCKNTGVDELVTSEKIGYAIDYDADEFINVLKNITNSDYKSINTKAKKLYTEKYCWSKMQEKLEKMIIDLD